MPPLALPVGHFQIFQECDLDVNVPQFTRALSQFADQLQKLLLVTALRSKRVDHGFHSPAVGAEVVNIFRRQALCKAPD